MRKENHQKWTYTAVGILLAAAFVVSLLLPALRLTPQEPENPIREENIAPVETISLGENADGDRASAALSGSGVAALGEQKGGTSSEASPREEEQEQEPEQEPEQTPEQTPEQEQDAPSEQPPEQTENTQDPTDSAGENTPDESENSATTGDSGEEEREGDLDLGLVLSWYKYGTEQRRALCPADSAVRQSILTTQLPGGSFRYSLSLNGLDAEDATLVSVEYSDDGTNFSPAGSRGTLDLALGAQGQTTRYTLRAEARYTRVNSDGTKEEQSVQFRFVIEYSDGLDLEARMQWQPASGGAAGLTCLPDAQARETLSAGDLADDQLRFSFLLDGESASDARIVSLGYSATNGEGGELSESGTLLMKPNDDGSDAIYTFTLSAEVENGGALEVHTFTFRITWHQAADVRLEFAWTKNMTERQSVTCEADARASVSVRRTELRSGELRYRLALTGEDAEKATIVSATCAEEGGAEQSLSVPDGSVTLRIPEGATAGKYTFRVQAQHQSEDGSTQTLEYTVVVRYSGDVRLELRYTLADGTAQSVTCENRQTRTAEVVKSDSLQDGVLPYTMTLSGGDADSGVQITGVTCYQSGSGRTLTLSPEGSVTLLTNEDGSEGENTFRVTASSAAGEEYAFTISIPYQQKGDGTVKIVLTGLTEGEEVSNGAERTIFLEVWSEDRDGKLLSRLTASETTLTLDGKTVACDSGTATKQQYTLIPENPEQEDQQTNTHTLVIRAADTYGNEGELTVQFTGKRSKKGAVIGHATIYIDMSVLGLGVSAPISYDVLFEEPASCVVAKAVWDYDAGDPFGTAASSFHWPESEARWSGEIVSDDPAASGFYLQSLGDGTDMGARSNALRGSWSDYGANKEEILARIDEIYGADTSYAALWRSIYLSNLQLNSLKSSYTVGEFDFTQGSGWMYSINGADYPMKGLSKYQLADGDTLTLRYTLAYGSDIGDGQIGSAFCVTFRDGVPSKPSHIWTTDTKTGKTVCSSCGVEKDADECTHEGAYMKDNGEGQCGLYCPKEGKYVGTTDEEKLSAHVWKYEELAEGDADRASMHRKVCARGCGAQELAAHSFGPETDTATCTEDGEKITTCADCGYERREASPATGHTPVWWADEREHWQVCQKCEAEIPDTRGAHSFQWDGYDWICACGNAHADVCSGEPVVTAGDCTHEWLHCPECGAEFTRTGDFSDRYPHEYGADGKCIHCGMENPDAPAPSPDPGTDPGKDPGEASGGAGGDPGGSGGTDPGEDSGGDAGTEPEV